MEEILNPYNNKNLKYQLSDKEIENLDKVWEFIDDFRETKITRNQYTKYITKKINKKYKIEDFYKYEKITEKIYWNLINKIKSEINIQSEIFNKKNFNTSQIKEVQNKILMRNNKMKESTINKAFIITNNNTLLYKYKYPDDLDLLAASIIINRSTYESIMSNASSIYNIEIEPYNNIIEFDYPFPNFNTIKSFTKTKKERINNIYKKYYKNI
jgi:hypothetical protein